MERAPISVTIIMLGGLLLILAGEMYYVFIGPHPDASGSIQENPLNPLFWSDHPGIASVTVGLILWIVGYILLSRRDRLLHRPSKEEGLADRRAATSRGADASADRGRG
jgi:hypothetical protein